LSRKNLELAIAATSTESPSRPIVSPFEGRVFARKGRRLWSGLGKQPQKGDALRNDK
jgi:hypothetical protein